MDNKKTILELIVELLKSDSSFVKVLSWMTAILCFILLFALSNYLNVGEDLWNLIIIGKDVAIELKEYIF